LGTLEACTVVRVINCAHRNLNLVRRSRKLTRAFVNSLLLNTFSAINKHQETSLLRYQSFSTLYSSAAVIGTESWLASHSTPTPHRHSNARSGLELTTTSRPLQEIPAYSVEVRSENRSVPSLDLHGVFERLWTPQARNHS